MLVHVVARPPRRQTLGAKQRSQEQTAFKKLVTSGLASGCLAFAGDEPVGWCSVGPRRDFPRLERIKALATDWKETTWSVTCFYIPSRWRRRGVAGALVKEATQLARDSGATELEAYPVRPYRSDQPIPAAFAWTGVPRVFEKAGFRNVTPPGNSRDIYKKTFRRPRR
jgi:GNAT superfamily N-acetyltransferase